MTEPPVFTRSYELALWTMRQSVRFPRIYRPSLGAALQERAIALLSHIAAAQFGSRRSESLRAAAESVDVLRVLVRLGKDLELMDAKHYVAGSRTIDEIGRMIGGWRKQFQGAG